MAVDANGNLTVAWIDNHEAWQAGDPAQTDDWDLRLRTATLPADVTPRVTKHYYANGQRIATRVDGDLYYVLGDHLGSTSLVVDESGAEQGYIIYDAYGQVVENTLSEGLTDRLFTGQVLDPTGLYYYNARYYDPLVGQFTQPDSLVADPLNPAAWNRFSYVYNSPSNYVDPSGHCVFGIDSAVCVAAAVVLVLAGTLLEVNASNPLPPSEVPSAEQGLTGLLLMAGGAGVAAYAEYVATGVTAACGDGDCTNEANQIVNQISKFQPSDAKAVAQFAEETPVVQAQRGFDSFGQVWNNVAGYSNAGKDLFLHRVGDRVTGMMEVLNAPKSNALEVKLLEGWGGAGTRLMQAAVRESINRGYGGRLILNAKDQAVKFYQDLGGILIDPRTNQFFFDEKTTQEILKIVP